MPRDVMPRNVTRRRFEHIGLVLFPFVWLGGLAAAAARFLTPLPRRPRQKRLELAQRAAHFSPAASAGAAGEVRAAPVEVEFNDRKVFVVHDGTRIRALDAACTHLDCNVVWAASDGSFHCPCHGAIFESDGRVRKRPATAPLREFEIAPIGEDGTIVVLDRYVERATDDGGE